MRLAAEFSGRVDYLIAVVIELGELTAGVPSVLEDMRRSVDRKAR